MPLGYQCQDCSYQGRKFKQGRCPACGSARIASKGDTEEEQKRGPLGLIVCIALWVYLAFEIGKRFLL